jgi:hypothetical protein
MRSSMTVRARGLVLTLLAATGLAASSAATPALAAPPTPSTAAPATYLALGDSVPFGYRGNQSAATYGNASNFVGYPELVGADRGLQVLNASCPGETTDSFMNVHAPSNGCESSPASPDGYRTAYPLHVDYGHTPPSEVSQLDYAVATLERTPNVRLVTLQLGANDGFLCQQTTADHCASVQEIAGVADHVRRNVSVILSTLRTRTHYTGTIEVVTYYALDYSDVAATTNTRFSTRGSRRRRAQTGRRSPAASSPSCRWRSPVGPATPPLPASCCRTTSTRRLGGSGCWPTRWSSGLASEGRWARVRPRPAPPARSSLKMPAGAPCPAASSPLPTAR